MTELGYWEFSLPKRLAAIAVELHPGFLLGVNLATQMPATKAQWIDWQVWLGPVCVVVTFYPRRG